MTSPAFGLGWHFWRRYRIFALSFLAYGIVMAIGVPAIVRMHLNAVAMVATIPLFIALFITIALFANPDADIVGRNSGYPVYLLTLPVRTSELVLWPMLTCIATVVLGWLALGLLILHPLGLALPLWWTALILAGWAACIPAVFWMPLGIPYLRVALLLGVILLVAGLGICGSALLTPSALVPLFFGIIGLAFQVAVYGVARARQGDTPEWKLRQERTDEVLQAQKPFTSPQQAQFWYEWSRNGILLPLIIGGFIVLFTGVLFLGQARVPLDLWHPIVSSEQEVKGVGGILVNNGVKEGLFLCLGITPMLAMSIGCGVWRPDTRKSDHSLNPFYAVRPLTSAEMVFAKFRMAVHSTVWTWAIVLLFEILALTRPAQDGMRVAPLGVLLLHYTTLKSVLWIALVLVAAMVQTWKSQVSTLFVNLCGRPWIVNTYATLTTGVQTALVVWVILLSTQRPDLGLRLLPILPYTVVSAVLLKLCLAAWALLRCRRQNLVSTRTAIKIGIGWLSATLVFWLLLCWLLGSNLQSAIPLLCGVALFLPLARLALAPPALDWNRHR